FDSDDLRLLEVLAGHAAVALENARLYEAQRREAERAKALLEVAGELAAARGLKDVLARTAAKAAHIAGCNRASIWLDDPSGGRLSVRVIHGDGSPADLSDLADELRAALDAHGEPFVLGFDAARYVVAPLVLDDGACGCIVADVEGSDDELLQHLLGLLGS